MRSAACGTWSSPITADMVAAAAVRLGGVAVDGNDVYWLEGRPREGGRTALVKWHGDGQIADATPFGANVRTLVQEYGGAPYLVAGRQIYYVEFTDQRVYRLTIGDTPEPLTPAGDWRYADFTADLERGRLVCVREDHTLRGREAVTTLVSLPIRGAATSGEVVAEGHDFYSTPRFSPDAAHLAWLAWRHPLMPWDRTELWLADVEPDGSIGRRRHVAGGERESIFQPGWAPDGTLYFMSDRSGWWNLYRLSGEGPQLVHGMDADFGRPQWQLGTSTWAVIDEQRLLVTYARRGRWYLGIVELATGTLSPLEARLEPSDTIAATRTHAILVGGTARTPDAIARIDLETGRVERIRAASEIAIGAGYLSEAEAIEFPTEGGLSAHAFYYAPQNADFVPAPEEGPPLLVISHGGPTGAAHARLNLEVQYWTSRGFAVVDVNYGGSTGYGRDYRERLRGTWGVTDVADCVNAARVLAERGKADARRLVIRGRSAGGYTTLCALTFRPDVFQAGACYYGVADLERLARDTHKFESRYLDGLIGPYPQAAGRYRARSPVHFIERLACPLILFQGLEDRVVPPVQSELMANAVRARGLPVALLTFAGEQHGFRRAETIVRCLEAELFFYGAVFGFVPAGPIPPLDIDNL